MSGNTGVQVDMVPATPEPINAAAMRRVAFQEPAPIDPNAVNREFPIPLYQFASVIRNQPDEMWILWLRNNHGTENHTIAEWTALIDAVRNEPAYPAQ